MQLSIVTVFELCKFLKLNPTIIYTDYHLRISVEDLITFFTFTVREVLIGYDSVHIQENSDQRKPAFPDTSRNAKYSHPRVFSQSRYTP